MPHWVGRRPWASRWVGVLRFLLNAALGFSLALGSVAIAAVPSDVGNGTPIAQSSGRNRRVPIERLAQAAYEKLPQFPRNNQYIRLTTGKPDPDHTLLRRMVDYHVYVRQRSPNYRLDWKLTLADYLGLNEVISPLSYPGSDQLRTHPLDGDRRSIIALSRDQRDQLVNTLAGFYNPQTAIAPSAIPPTARPSQPQTNPAPASQPSLPPLPTDGAADLLKPKPR